MRILFIANHAAGLYKEIEAELLRKGHSVITIKDELFRFDPALKTGVNVPYIKKILWNRNANRYWGEKFNTMPELNNCFDMLLALSGMSVTEALVNRLKQRNPQMRTVLYTWDGCDFYDFKRHFPYIDKCYTFDLQDTIKNTKWKLLPIYYSLPPETNVNRHYDLFCVGSNHDGRYSFIKKLLPQLDGVNFYFRIVAPEIKLDIKDYLYLLFKSSQKRKERKEEVAFSQGKENPELLLRGGMPMTDYMEKLNESHCILDDQREGQSGLTARFMWALGAKKKVITTNKWALQYPFVSQEQVAIISKETPILPMDFLYKDIDKEHYSDVKCYSISNWVNKLLEI